MGIRSDCAVCQRKTKAPVSLRAAVVKRQGEMIIIVQIAIFIDQTQASLTKERIVHIHRLPPLIEQSRRGLS